MRTIRLTVKAGRFALPCLPANSASSQHAQWRLEDKPDGGGP